MAPETGTPMRDKASKGESQWTKEYLVVSAKLLREYRELLEISLSPV